MPQPQDIFEEGIDLIVEKGIIDLSKQDVAPYEIPKDYIIRKVTTTFRTFEDESEKIKSIFNNIKKELNKKGYEKDIVSNINLVLHEAFQNAEKYGITYVGDIIRIAYKIKDECAQFAVIDEKGKIDSKLLEYVRELREGDYNEENEINFYEFAGRQLRDMRGWGIFITHLNMDEVSYYKHSKGGLVIHMVKNK